MTTRIKVRRDSAVNWFNNNPILALGEPGLETDTNQFKFGDGTTAWNDLTYANSTGGGRSSRWVSLLNTCGSGQYTSQSADAKAWTAPITIESNQYSYIWGMAIGPNSVVYVSNQYPDGDNFYWASNPNEEPQPISPFEYASGPNGESVNWNYLKYEGGYFIAFGYYQDTAPVTTPSIYVPYWIYSQDGKTWNRGAVNLSEVETIIDTAAGSDANIGGLQLQDVSYNGTGWLFSTTWYYNGWPAPLNSGGFYITSITGTLNSASYGSSIPTAYAAKWDGSKWWSFMWDEGDDTYQTNASLNPTSGSWTSHTISTIANSVFGVRSGYSYSVESWAQGTIDGVNYIVMGIDDGQALVTTDKGSTWHGVIPSVYLDDIYAIDSSNIDFNNSNPLYIGEKITITGSTVSAMNGTFYVGTSDGGGGTYWPLYTDSALQNQVDMGTWIIDNVAVTANWNYGENKIRVDDASGLRVGMTSGSYGPFGTAIITAINGNVLTMNQHNFSTATNTTVNFKATITYSHGNYINTGLTRYGNNEFATVISYDGPGSSLAVAQANPTVQANWQTYWSSWNQQSPEVLNNGYIPILWISDFQYGTVNSVPTSWSYTNPNLEYAINEMVLTDRFTLSLTSQGQYSPPVSTTLFLDPSTASWSLGSQSSYFGSADLGSISSFNDNDVRLTINDKKLAVNYDGTVDFPAYHFPNTDGTADQVLKTDGSGNLTWTTISSGTSLPSDSTGWLHNNGSGTLAWTTPGYIAPTSRNTNGNPYTISLGDMGALLMAIGAVNSITIPLAATVSLTDAFEMTIATTGPATSMDFVLASGVNVYYSGTNTIFTSGISVPAGKPAIIKLIYTGANEYWIIDGPGLTGT